LGLHIIGRRSASLLAGARPGIRAFRALVVGLFVGHGIHAYTWTGTSESLRLEIRLMASGHSRPRSNESVASEDDVRGTRASAPEAGVASIASTDILEHEQLVRPWDVEIEQLAPGPFRGLVDAVSTPSLVIYEERWPRKARVRGCNPSEHVVIGASLGGQHGSVSWCRSDLSPQHLATAAPASEVAFNTPEESRHAVALMTPSFLEQGLGKRMADRLCSDWILSTSRGDGLEFGRHVVRTVRRYIQQPRDLSRPLERQQIESDFMEVLIRCSSRLTMPSDLTDSSRRARAVDAALAKADSCRGQTTAFELSIAADVSQRTLEHAFRERFGITPGAYLRIKRLNGAHRDLIESNPAATSVSRIASDWGFRHLGRFSSFHRRIFGETPYQALHRARPFSSHSLVDVLSLQNA
jgi:AraC-like DNA-binding protein